MQRLIGVLWKLLKAISCYVEFDTVNWGFKLFTITIHTDDKNAQWSWSLQLCATSAFIDIIRYFFAKWFLYTYLVQRTASRSDVAVALFCVMKHRVESEMHSLSRVGYRAIYTDSFVSFSLSLFLSFSLVLGRSRSNSVQCKAIQQPSSAPS